MFMHFGFNPHCRQYFSLHLEAAIYIENKRQQTLDFFSSQPTYRLAILSIFIGVQIV